jgi:phosphocarrier protein
MIQRQMTIVNKLGLHARAASKLVNCASSFAAEIWLQRGEREINGKSIMGVLTLAAGKGTILEVRAEGIDEQQALETIQQLIESRFGEDE